jgi:hypothetical protein
LMVELGKGSCHATFMADLMSLGTKPSACRSAAVTCHRQAEVHEQLQLAHTARAPGISTLASGGVLASLPGQGAIIVAARAAAGERQSVEGLRRGLVRRKVETKRVVGEADAIYLKGHLPAGQIRGPMGTCVGVKPRHK